MSQQDTFDTLLHGKPLIEKVDQLVKILDLMNTLQNDNFKAIKSLNKEIKEIQKQLKALS